MSSKQFSFKIITLATSLLTLGALTFSSDGVFAFADDGRSEMVTPFADDGRSEMVTPFADDRRLETVTPFANDGRSDTGYSCCECFRRKDDTVDLGAVGLPWENYIKITVI